MDLETQLRDLGPHLDHPAGDDLVDRLTAELGAPVGPAPVAAPRRAPTRWLGVAAAVASVLVVGAAWFAFAREDGGSAEARRPRGDATPRTTATTAPATPPAIETVDLAAARAAVAIPVRVPDGVTASPVVTVDRRAAGGLVALEYPTFTLVEVAAPAGVTAGGVAGLEAGSQVQPVSVRAHPGLWITGTHHEITYLDRDGVLRRGPTRTTGHVLLWVEDGVTYRVEGFHEQDDAMAVADSLR